MSIKQKLLPVLSQVGLPQLTLYGQQEVVIEQCSGILTYDEARVLLRYGGGFAEILGQGLSLCAMTGTGVTVRGRILSLGFPKEGEPC